MMPNGRHRAPAFLFMGVKQVTKNTTITIVQIGPEYIAGVTADGELPANNTFDYAVIALAMPGADPITIDVLDRDENVLIDHDFWPIRPAQTANEAIANRLASAARLAVRNPAYRVEPLPGMGGDVTYIVP